jgi:hypothetical protein
MLQGGRAYDPAPYIAFCMHRLGPHIGAVGWHMGKIVSYVYSYIIGTLRKDSIDGMRGYMCSSKGSSDPCDDQIRPLRASSYEPARTMHGAFGGSSHSLRKE